MTYEVLSWVGLGTKIVGSIGLFVAVMLYIYQDNILYIPNPPGFPKTPDENPENYGYRSPSEWSVAGKKSNGGDSIPFEEHYLTTKDGEKLHVWLFLQNESQSAPTLIYFHGNAGNMGFRLPNAAEMYARVGVNVLMMDYRGYGKSTGKPTELGIQEDAKTVLEFVAHHPKLTKTSIISFGRSLGGAVSIWLAKEYPALVKAIIVENTFLSVGAMVDVLLPYVKLLKPLVLRIKWESEKSIRALKQPIFFISGDSDELVPPSHMTTLRDSASMSTDRDFYTVKGGSHNDTWVKAGAEYYKRMKAFVSRVTQDTLTTCESDDSTSTAALPTMKTNFQVR